MCEILHGTYELLLLIGAGIRYFARYLITRRFRIVLIVVLVCASI